MKKKKNDPLTGEALLAKVKELEHLAKEEKAKECGYFTITKNGVEARQHDEVLQRTPRS